MTLDAFAEPDSPGVPDGDRAAAEREGASGGEDGSAARLPLRVSRGEDEAVGESRWIGRGVQIGLGRPGEPGARGVRTISEAEAREGLEVEVRPDRPDAGERTGQAAPLPSEGEGEEIPPPPSRLTGPVATALVDAKVGDINGRPVYAMRFLSELEDRLRAEAGRMSYVEWRRMAETEIRRRLDAMIEDELLRAEALASLRPEQRAGLMHWLDQQRRDLESRNYGSGMVASRRLEERLGQTTHEYLDRRKDEALIDHQFNQQIRRRVHVSWRDIRQEYERRWDEFNPDPTAVLRMIRVRSTNEDAVEEVSRALAGGERFEEVAERSFNTFNRTTGGLTEQTFSGPYSEAELFRIDSLNELAWSLSEGTWGGPVEVRGFTHWLKLERIVRQSAPLYQAQLPLQRQIQQRRLAMRRAMYVGGLRERASFTSVDEMVSRLIEIAEERYLTPEQRGAGRG